jgi:hypothetical protein
MKMISEQFAAIVKQAQVRAGSQQSRLENPAPKPRLNNGRGWLDQWRQRDHEPANKSEYHESKFRTLLLNC